MAACQGVSLELSYFKQEWNRRLQFLNIHRLYSVRGCFNRVTLLRVEMVDSVVDGDNA